jgi:hypothetical protein
MRARVRLLERPPEGRDRQRRVADCRLAVASSLAQILPFQRSGIGLPDPIPLRGSTSGCSGGTLYPGRAASQDDGEHELRSGMVWSPRWGTHTSVRGML